MRKGSSSLFYCPKINVEMSYLKKVDSASVATALARYDFPVPGGPYKRNALHGRRFPKAEDQLVFNYNVVNQRGILLFTKYKFKIPTLTW